MHDWNDSAGWGWTMMVFGVLFWASIIVLGVWFVRTWSSPRVNAPSSAPSTASAQQLLDERFARGEIEVEEYERRRDVLRGASRSGST
jgi:putative membrane protein